jgi:hypothetical protein
MSIDEKIKAPEGKFAVCLWDSYPRMEPPIEIVETFDTEEEARKYSKEKNDELMKTFYAEKSRAGSKRGGTGKSKISGTGGKEND